MGDEVRTYVNINDVGPDDTLMLMVKDKTHNVWSVTYVTNEGVWLKHKGSGTSWILTPDEFNMAQFDIWDGQNEVTIKVLSDE